MALEANGSVTRPAVPPVSYITAVWLGMSPDDIARGIANGIIDAPPGWGEDATTSSTSTRAALIDNVHSGSSESETRTLHHTLTDASAGVVGLPVADRDHVQALFRSLDPALADSAFDQIWTPAGDTDAARSSSLLSYLARALLGTGAGNGGESESDMGTMTSLQTFVADSRHHGLVVDLHGKSGQELMALAKSDAGYRYALLNLDSMAIVGNASLHMANNTNGQLDRFDPDTGEQNFSDAWLADRGKLLAWKLSTDGGGSASIEGES